MQAEEARSTAKRAGTDVDVIFAENSLSAQVQQPSSHLDVPRGETPDDMEQVARRAVGLGIEWILLHAGPPYIPW
jgi:hypothetical protein